MVSRKAHKLTFFLLVLFLGLWFTFYLACHIFVLTPLQYKVLKCQYRKNGVILSRKTVLRNQKYLYILLAYLMFLWLGILFRRPQNNTPSPCSFQPAKRRFSNQCSVAQPNNEVGNAC